MTTDGSLNTLLDEYFKYGLYEDPEIEIPDNKSIEIIEKEIREIEDEISKLK